jgi:serine/threonine protein kinase
MCEKNISILKKEILIFMEFCGDKCTLDQISRESSGLPEELVRSYTNSLLQAVYALHENNIIHRDIKGANIFLKTIDSKVTKMKTILKLGDFGSSIRLKSDPSMSNGGVFAQGFMGTLCKIFIFSCLTPFLFTIAFI